MSEFPAHRWRDWTTTAPASTAWPGPRTRPVISAPRATITRPSFGTSSRCHGPSKTPFWRTRPTAPSTRSSGPARSPIGSRSVSAKPWKSYEYESLFPLHKAGIPFFSCLSQKNSNHSINQSINQSINGTKQVLLNFYCDLPFLVAALTLPTPQLPAGTRYSSLPYSPGWIAALF